MSHITLRYIAAQIVEYTTAVAGGGGLCLEEILSRLDVISTHNPHLRNPLNEDPNVYYSRGRETPFSGDERVTGEYFVFQHIGHVGEMSLIELQNREELEHFLLSDAGLFNPFTTYLLAIVRGQLKKYNLFYKNFWKREHEFVKSEQYETDDMFTKKYRRRRLQWADDW